MSAAPLIIPVENQVRELDAKLLLSAVAAERGFPVILGSRAFVHYAVASVPRGIYLAKSMRPLSNRMFRILRQLGHVIVAWDEEGLVRYGGAEYYRRRLSPRALREVSHLVVWGEDNAEALRAYPGYHGAPVHVIGNPRMDLMRPELRDFYAAERERLRRQYGEFVLVNTNFSQINHYLPELGEMKAALDGRGPNADCAFDVQRAHMKFDLFEQFKAMLPLLCKALPEHNIVVRPHPSEHHRPWLDVAAAHANLHVVNEGSVAPWLQACRALVANGCTTLIEAAVLGVPHVNFRPLSAPAVEDPLPQHFGCEANTVAEVIELLRAMLAGESGPPRTPAQEALLARNVAALHGPLAADRLVEVLVNEDFDKRPPPRPPLPGWLAGWLHTQLRTCVKRINTHRAGHRNDMRFHDHRFPPVAAAELQDRIDRLGHLSGRFEHVRVSEISRHLYHIDDRHTAATPSPASAA